MRVNQSPFKAELLKKKLRTLAEILKAYSDINGRIKFLKSKKQRYWVSVKMIQSLEKLRDKLKLALKYQKKKNKKGGHTLFNQSLKTKYVIKTIRMYTYFILNGLRNKRNHYRKLFKRSQLSINLINRKQKKQLKKKEGKERTFKKSI